MAISNYCSQLGDACNNIGEYKLGSEAFETAFRAEMSPACGTPELRAFTMRLSAAAAGEKDAAEYARGVELLNKALEMGYTDDNGMIYYYLFHNYLWASVRRTVPMS